MLSFLNVKHALSTTAYWCFAYRQLSACSGAGRPLVWHGPGEMIPAWRASLDGCQGPGDQSLRCFEGSVGGLEKAVGSGEKLGWSVGKWRSMTIGVLLQVDVQRCLNALVRFIELIVTRKSESIDALSPITPLLMLTTIIKHLC